MMEQNRLNLRWNNHSLTFVSKLDQFRLQELYCDATIACDGQIYPVHRVVLSACSEFFASIFASTRCHNPVVVLQDVGKTQLESLLIYMYQGEVRVLQEDLPTFIKVAESLHVKGLAVPTSEIHHEHQADRVCHNSYYGPSEEIQHSDNGSCPPIPKVQQMPYMNEVLSSSSQSHRMIQNFPHDERSIFHQGRAGEINLKRKSHEMDYVRQNDNDFQRRPQIIEHVHHLHQNEAPVKILHKMEHIQHLKKDDIQIGHPRDTGHHMQSLGTSDHNARVRPSEHSPLKSPSEEKIFRSSSDGKFGVRSNTSNELEKRNDLAKENSCRSDGIQDAGTTLSNGYITGHIASSDHIPRSHVPVEHMNKKVCDSSKDDSTEYSSLQYNSFHVSSTNGTFQNLVASEENTIKNEPEDSLADDYENASLSISEDFDDAKDDESDSFTLKIAEEASPCDESSNPEKYKDSNQEVEQSVADSVPSEPLSATEPHITRPTGMPASQLRRELLRPIHHKTGPKHIPQSVPQSIPHPVIAPRDPERHLREPPPLMKIDPKIPLLINEVESERPPKYSRKDSQENGHSSHLLVKAPPTYHSHTSPIHFSLHVHNQHLGSVMVNGGAPISEIPSNSQNDRLTVSVNDGPLNLSGQKSSPEMVDEKDNQTDPFLGKIITNRKKRLRGPKSWEFLVRLLKDPTTNPFLIRWENEESGVFRLVQPAAIAQRWGRRTGKHASECLSYENFARGLRYHYATGALQPVSERSFVYRFGPKALKTLKQCDSASFPYL
ncbi:broad-complex core protein-like [Penaeus chinensis]|uniref:broad-complex core protein-like n=1 Tax=Penaeus chinensis TaxID=139456 RepID=UPI001FB5CAB1|nr:broad-complex core protein-like [Penaeus chinensis]